MARIIGAILVSVVAALAFGASTQAAPTLEARMQATYDTQCGDIVSGNFTDFMRTISPNFTATVGGQTITRDVLVSHLKAFASEGSITHCTTTIQSVQESANVIVAIVQQEIDGTFTGKPVRIDAGKRDLWDDQAGGPVLTSTSSIWQTVYLNGQLQQETGTPPSTPPLSVPSPRGTP